MSTAEVSRRWQIRGKDRYGNRTTYNVEAFNHAGALERARALGTIVISCALFETHSERADLRATAIRAHATKR